MSTSAHPHRRGLACLLLCKLACGATAPAPPPAATPQALAQPARPLEIEPPGLRLSRDVVPTIAALELEVDPDSPYMRGKVAFELEIQEPVTAIWLHALGLEIEPAHLHRDGAVLTGRSLADPRARPGQIAFGFGRKLAPGKARLELSFRGELGHHVGLFRQRHDGAWYVFSDFQATDARRAFPAFDEPIFKIPWKVTLIVPRDQKAFSNAPQTARTAYMDDRAQVDFAQTQPLPSYLVAIAVGPFEVVEGPTDPIPLRAITLRGTAHRARAPLATTAELLRITIDEMGLPVPIPKLDLIAVPRFDGAMENPGLFTFAASILLGNAKSLDPRDRLTFPRVAAHELAHLWFGDSVTMAWWNDLWLSEGFATWMAAEVLRRWRPGSAAEIDLVVGRDIAMEYDARPHVGALHREITNPRDIRDAFDSIIYNKGGAVLEMLEAWVGEGPFRRAIRAYLRDHADGTATSRDFLRAAVIAGGDQVGAALRTFLDQPGVPELRVELVCEGKRAYANLRQSRHGLLGVSPTSSKKADALWQIPVCVRHRDGRDCRLLSRREGSIPLSARGCPSWLHPNAGEVGYYRYVLPKRDLYALADKGRPHLTDPEKVGLAIAIRAGMESGRLSLPVGMRALALLARDQSPLVAMAIADAVQTLGRSAPAFSRKGYERYIQQLFGARARKLGFSPRRDDPIGAEWLRPLLVDLVGREGKDKALVARARKRANRWLARANSRPSGAATLFLEVAASHGDKALFHRIRKRLRQTRDAPTRDLLVGALSRFGRPPVANRVLRLIISGELSRFEAYVLLRRAAETASGSARAFAFVRNHYRAIREHIPDLVRGHIPYVTANLCSERDLDQVRGFFLPRIPEGERGRALDLAIEEIERCIAFRAHHGNRAARLLR